jgi:glycosyltransferase involved in cell wall biosynthesis
VKRVRTRPMVAITQPYIPGYRVPLWSRVVESLAANGVECRVFTGGDAEQLAIRARRGDGAEVPWATHVRTRTIQPFPGSAKIQHRLLPSRWRRRDVLLVTEMQALNVNAWQSLFGRRPYITFGHGSSSTTDQNALASMLENYLNRKATHVLTYTETGRQHVIASARVEGVRVSAFRNSTDTVRLREAMSAVDASAAKVFREKHGIPPDAQLALYLGAINKHKNIDLLVRAADEVFASSEEWWLVIAGDGEEYWKVRDLADRSGRVVLLGQSTPELYAPAAVQSAVLLNPGRVGLVAVDALVMNLPILTTSGSAHAPEHEYLRPGVDVIEVDPDVASFASGWRRQSGRTAVEPPLIPTVEAAADRIVDVILAELGV